jgi:hypothetical protein
MADGRREIVERYAESLGQLLTSVVNNDLPLREKLAVVTALERGGRVEVLTRLNPFEVAINIATPNGGSLVNLARYVSSGESAET